MTTTRTSTGILVVRAHDVAWLWIAGGLLLGAIAVPFVGVTRGSSALGSAAMVIVAVVALAAYEDRVAEFRPTEGRVHWMRRTLRRRERGTLRFDGITAVELVRTQRRSSHTYGLYLLTGGRRFALHGSTTGARTQYEEAGRAIARLLNTGDREVPFLA